MKQAFVNKQDTLCICKHPLSAHNKMNETAWSRFNNLIEKFTERKMIDDTEKFYTEYLLGGNDSEWKCSACSCEAFKRDNLKYLESLTNE